MPSPTHRARLSHLMVRGWPLPLALLWLPTLYAATLLPTPTAGRPGAEPFALCLICGDRGGADVVLNLALFVPLGLLAKRRFGTLGAVAIGAALSTGIEVAQLFLPGRFSTLADLISNTTGALVGVALYRSLHALARGARPHGAVGTMMAAFAAGVVMLGGWLVAPAPTDEAYWGQWTPDFGPGTRYTGTVLAAAFNGRPFPSARLPPSTAGRDELLRDWTLTGTVQKGPPTGIATSVLSIFDGRQEEILYLGAHKEHLLLRERLRAQDWRLDRPELVSWDALAPVAEGRAMRLSTRRVGDDRCLGVDGHEVCDLGFTPGRLWSLLLYPSGAPPWLQRLADGAWMFVLFLPIGLFASSRRSALADMVLAAGLVALAAAATRLLLDPLLELAGAFMGVLFGYAVAAALCRIGGGTARCHPSSPRGASD